MSASAPGQEQVLTVGPLELLPAEHLGRVDGMTLTLSMIELRMLTVFAQRADHIVSREELYTAVWGREFRPGERSIDVYVHKLRVKLEAALPGWAFIHTHFRFGYRLAPEQRH
jgi:DNA-binding response OmpR family regulator